MPDRDDIDGALKRDMERVGDLHGGSGVGLPPLPVAIEGVLWALLGVTIIGMVATMPWVGPEKAISGAMWIGVTVMGVCLWGGLALLFRGLRSGLATRIDRTADSRINK